MKQSDTQLGKAYVKAKESNPPPPTPPGPDDYKITVGSDKADVASRRYQKIQTKKVNADLGMDVTYDRVTNKIQFELYNPKTAKRISKVPFSNTEDTIRKVVLDAAKMRSGQPLTDIERKKIGVFVKGMADFADQFKDESIADV